MANPEAKQIQCTLTVPTLSAPTCDCDFDCGLECFSCAECRLPTSCSDVSCEPCLAACRTCNISELCANCSLQNCCRWDPTKPFCLALLGCLDCRADPTAPWCPEGCCRPLPDMPFFGCPSIFMTDCCPTCGDCSPVNIPSYTETMEAIEHGSMGIPCFAAILGLGLFAGQIAMTFLVWNLDCDVDLNWFRWFVAGNTVVSFAYLFFLVWKLLFPGVDSTLCCTNMCGDGVRKVILVALSLLTIGWLIMGAVLVLPVDECQDEFPEEYWAGVSLVILYFIVNIFCALSTIYNLFCRQKADRRRKVNVV